MNQFLSTQLQFVSNAGDKLFLIPLVSLGTIAYLYSLGYKRESLIVVLASLSPVVSMALKFIFRQVRPSSATPSYSFDVFSFPSSHTFAYTVFWGFILYLSFKLLPVPVVVRGAAVASAVYFLALIGISRVYLGQHYVWDVVAGYIFGVVYLLLLIVVYRSLGN